VVDYQTPVWKEQGIRVSNGKISLSNGRNQPPLILSLPNDYHTANIRKVELTWCADHYELCLTIDTGETNPPLIRKVKTAGVDLGEINIAACVSEDGEAIVVTGRHLRSVKQLRNKRHAELTGRIDQCQKGSRRWKRLKQRKAQASAKLYRQQRDILHKASRQVIEFCREQEVAHISMGDVRDIGDGVDLGKEANQKISQWPHGQFAKYIEYKARRYGISTTQDPEDYSTRTCCHCGQVKANVKGRVYNCSGCGVITPRDANGGANICSRKRYGKYGHVQVNAIKYLRPISVGRSRAVDTRPCCSFA
jgi:putative transposase